MNDVIERNEPDLDLDGGVGTGGVLASVLAAAAIGAGAALLLAPEPGRETRRQVGRRLRRLRDTAGRNIDELRHEAERRVRRPPRRTGASAVLVAALAGLVIGALFTPDGTEMRQRLGRQADTLGRRARERVREIRSRRERVSRRPFIDQFQQPATPVRTVQELGRTPEELI